MKPGAAKSLTRSDARRDKALRASPFAPSSSERLGINK
ncbi:hypothetical protein APY03_5161 [Variovorax sp. WDL1]|nr:hypothetical protein APY03_5161 [Variovorax sp. WDL1]